MCSEHYEYVKSYLNILLNEYQFRFQKEHGLAKFIEWLDFDAPKLNIPAGNLKHIYIPWKCLNPKYRKKDLTAGYRAQYKALLENDGIKVTDFKNRDIPEFLVSKTNKWME